jgi:hypothetical protein
MAIEVLVKAADNVNPSASPGSLWRSGDIVVIKQSPAVWGSLEGPPAFWRITIDGINLTDPAVETWLAARTQVDIEGGTIFLARRNLFLNVAALPPPVRNDILDNGLATIPVNRLQGFRDAVVVR